MARLNVAMQKREFTAEGAPAYAHMSVEQALRRAVLSCLLWEDEFYEDGKKIAERIEELASKVNLNVLADLAIAARGTYNLRHVPLLLACVLAKRGAGQSGVSDVICNIVQRADEMGELLAVYWRGGRRMVPHQMRKGLARAFAKFDEYALAKYDRDGAAVKLRDVLRLVRPKPCDEAQSALWHRVKERSLVTPDTWEVALSGGADKKEAFTRLLQEHKLGYLALLRNLRNMSQAGVDEELVRAAILARRGGAQRVLPFRYVAAARAAPQYEPQLDAALQTAITEMAPLPGSTFVLVDVSGSMDAKLSARSDLTRRDAAATLASILPGQLRMFTFSHSLVEVPPRRGMAGVDAIVHSQLHGATYLGAAVRALNAMTHDRIIVITDEQSHDAVPAPIAARAYLINVASNRNGVGYGPWTHIDGFSESVLRYIQAVEAE